MVLPWSAAVTSVLMTTEHTLWQTGMLVVAFDFLAIKPQKNDDYKRRYVQQ